MLYVGIDVSKDKHDCCILGADGQVVVKPFAVPNSLDGFETLTSLIKSHEKDPSKVKIGLEATGHYNYNLLGYLLEKGMCCCVLNPLVTNLYRKAHTLRLTKTDKIDSKVIAKMLISEPDLKPYSKALYHNEQLKSLTRYRFSKNRERSHLKQRLSLLVNILFPELEHLFSTLHIRTVYAILVNYSSAKAISEAHIAKLTNLIASASKGRFRKDKAEQIREAARNSIGSFMPAKSLELKHTVELIRILDNEISEIESDINEIMSKLNTPLLSIPGIGMTTAPAIISEIGDFSRFSSPDKILAFAGFSPSMYQSGKLGNSHARMEKRGSRYLRNALYNAAKDVCKWDPVFSAYLAKKLGEGKHYYVALSHAIRKLVRVIYRLQTTGEQYNKVV